MSTSTPVPSPSPAPTLVPLPASGTPTCLICAVERPANNIITIHLRPNNDPAGDSKSTFYVNQNTVASDIQAWVTQEKARVVAEYLAAHNALSTLIAAIGT